MDARVPPLWRRRRHALVAVLVLVLLAALMWLYTPLPLPRAAAPRAFGDMEIAELVRTIPGAQPGVPAPPQAELTHVHRNGSAYPTREELAILFLTHMRDATRDLDRSPWAAWLPWLEERAPRPKYAHYDFLTELRRAQGGSLADVRQYLAQPLVWRVRRERELGLSVFSKTYCPYSRRAKALLAARGARFYTVEADIREDYDVLHRVLIALFAHRTFPTVVAGGTLVGGCDDLLRLDADGHLDPILRGIGAL